MCYPKEEGGLRFRSLHDISKALFSKLLWSLRVLTSSFWSTYIGNKFYKKIHPTITRNSGTSHVWRRMLKVRKTIEYDIWWQIKLATQAFGLITRLDMGYYTMLRVRVSVRKNWR